MPHHDWSEEKFDWDSLNDAIDKVSWICRKIGRIGIHSKEKWGCHRCTPYFFNDSLHSITHPGYVYCQYPKWLWKIDIYYIPYFFKYTGLGWLIRQYQYQIYKLAFLYVCIKHLHIVDEIVSDIDGYELIYKGKEIHDKHWISYNEVEE